MGEIKEINKKKSVFVLLHEMQGMTFTQDEILEVLKFMMARMVK